jgi:ATP-dependent 26S proteasome regulatory subunit
MIEFWLNERKRCEGRRLVAIFEDAEMLLAPREERSQALVSDLLNASDGLLGDCLELQIIATVNCPLEKLDPAVTRPGRLIGYREFRRLNREEALAVAESKGIQISASESLSLAEIYNLAATPNAINDDRRAIGFNVA